MKRIIHEIYCHRVLTMFWTRRQKIYTLRRSYNFSQEILNHQIWTFSLIIVSSDLYWINKFWHIIFFSEKILTYIFCLFKMNISFVLRKVSCRFFLKLCRKNSQIDFFWVHSLDISFKVWLFYLPSVKFDIVFYGFYFWHVATIAKFSFVVHFFLWKPHSHIIIRRRYIK